MAQVTFTISPDDLARLKTAICGLHAVHRLDGESDTDLTMRIIRGHLIEQVRRWEHKQAVGSISVTEITIE